MNELLPLPSWKIRPWLKWILYPLLALPLAIPVLLVASLVFSGLTGSQTRRDGWAYAGELRNVETELRRQFYGRSGILPLTLEELSTKHALSDRAAQFLARYPHEFVPFTPQTPGDAVVLTVHGYWTQPDHFTKRDLTADPSAPDHLPEPSPASPVP